MNIHFCKRNVFVMKDYDVISCSAKYTSYCSRGREIKECPYFHSGDTSECKMFLKSLNFPNVFTSVEDMTNAIGKSLKS